MNLSEPFIKRPVMTTMVMLGITIFGILSYLTLPISNLPPIKYPTILVSGGNPGSDAWTIAAALATPLEQQIMQTPGLSSVVSTSTYGGTSISCTFDLDVDRTTAMTYIGAAIQRAAGNLPEQMPTPPTYEAYNPSATPAIFLAVTSDSLTMPDLYDYANNAIRQPLSMIQGVSKVGVYGSPRAVRVKLNPNALATLNLSLGEISQQVFAASQLLGGGRVYDSSKNFTINPNGQLMSGEAYQDIIVAYRDNGPIRIRDIGHAETSISTENFFIDFWGKDLGREPAQVIAILPEAGANTVDICDTVVKMLPEMQKILPPSLNITVLHNQADLIRASLNDVKFTLGFAFLLVVIVIFIFLGNPSSTVIPAIVLPLSLIGTFIVMRLAGYNIDTLSLLGLTLVVGFLVDDAIVVLENMVRHMELGKTPMRAAIDASAEISTTILSMTLSLSAVFIPLLFMPGIIGRMFHEFAMVVVVAVLFSGFLALTLSPLMGSRLLRPGRIGGPIEQLANRTTNALLKRYIPMLKWVLHHKWVPVVTVSISLLIAIGLFAWIPQNFFPPGDTGIVQGVTIASQGVSPTLLNQYQAELLLLGKENPYVKSVISTANMGGSTDQGSIFFNLVPLKDRPPIEKVVAQLQEKTNDVVGLQTYLRPLPQLNLDVSATQQRSQYTYILSTVDDPQQLYDATTDLLAAMQKSSSFSDVSTSMEIDDRQLKVNILRDKARTYGITVNQIEEALGLAFGENRLNTFNTQYNIYWVILELEDEFRRNAESLAKLWLTPDNFEETGQLVPLSAVVEVEETTGPVSVNHTNQFVSTTIFFNVGEGTALGTAIAQLDQLSAQVIPPAIKTEFLGAAATFNKTAGEFSLLIGIAIIAIYILLGILYESFLHPLTILSALPGGLFGALFMLLIFDSTLSIYAYVGIIVLVGIIMKNGIMLVEFAIDYVEKGDSAYDSIIDACRVRFRPILMTTVAAAMGAVPIALGFGADASSRRPLGLVILGGLFFAQLVTYFFTPTIYLEMERLQEWYRAKRKARKHR